MTVIVGVDFCTVIGVSWVIRSIIVLSKGIISVSVGVRIVTVERRVEDLLVDSVHNWLDGRNSFSVSWNRHA